MSLVGTPALGMAAEHTRPALLGNASAAPSQALGASFLRWARAGGRLAFRGVVNRRRLHRMSPSRHKGFSSALSGSHEFAQVGWLRLHPSCVSGSVT